MNDETVKADMSNDENDQQVQVDNDEEMNVQMNEDKQSDNQGEQRDSSTEDETDANEENTSTEDDEKAKLEQEIEELKSRYLRVQADFDNFRKRTKTEREATAKYRSQSLAEQLLPVLDNFERALVVEATNEESKSILTGVEMVYRQFTEALQQEGIEEIEALGEPFDPHKHQAVMQEKSEEHDSGIVIEVLQKGYKLKDRVIRPSMVKVSE
ncbi:nucleotide exchange factor GrpE [Pueribacillus sp. YX66]|uniref:nucleotide exchange factor GrpE n=1 Tax=Pueribacillus sp. YX66 TaxID=3229242 RepID=UPI00358D655D